MEALMLNLAYAVYFGSAVVRGLLPVRIMLLSASILYILWGAVAGNRSIVAWNIAFGLLSIYQIWRILQQRRPIVLSDQERIVYDEIFHQLSAQDFVFLWEMGEEQEIESGMPVTQQREPVKYLYLLLDGSLRVSSGDREVARLAPHKFVGEMSLLSEQPATADVVAVGDVTVRRWSQDHLRGLSRIRPEVASKLWQILGQDLIQKVLPTPAQRQFLADVDFS